MVRFYFVRHGEKERVPFDPKLTPIGIQQATATAEFLRKIKFKEVVASPKSRTQQTAQIIAKELGLPVTTIEELQERLEWLGDQELSEFLDEWYKTDIDRSYSSKVGMSSSGNGARVRKILDSISERHKEGNILVVSHGGTIGDALRNLFGEEAVEHLPSKNPDAKYIKIHECSITIVERENNEYKLISVNGKEHLL
jgi:probable phosphoglycerate mutase